MPFRPVSYDYSEVADFSSKSLLAFPYPATTYTIDGQMVGQAADLTSLKQTIMEFEADDADGSADPTDLSKRTAGGVVLTRSSDLSTITLGPRPACPYARIVALREMLHALNY